MTERIGLYIGAYQVQHLLGSGNFADVYLGEHRYLHTQAAIKVLHAQLAAEEVEGFLTEAQRVSQVTLLSPKG